MQSRSNRRAPGSHWLQLVLLFACFTVAVTGCEGCLSRDPRGSPVQTSDADPVDRREWAESWAEGRLPESILSGEPRRGGSVTIRAYYEPDNLNPLASGSGMTQWMVLHEVVETLVRRDPFGADVMLPALAKSWEVDETGTSITFRLREDARWHDGPPLTARDVLATYAKLGEPLVTAGELKPLYAMLEGVEAPDDHTIVIRWKRPYFLALDTIARTPIQPAHILVNLDARGYNDAAANPLNEAPIGTGPYRFIEWEKGQRVILQRNEDWWGEGPWLDEIVYRFIPDHDQARESAERGELDVWDAIPPRMWIEMEESEELQGRFHRARGFSLSQVFVGWNTRRPHLLEAKVRRALAGLLDRDSLLEGALHGLASPATCHFRSESEGCDPSLESPPHDPTGAMETLTEAGWRDPRGGGLLERDGAVFRIELMIYPGSGSSELVATMMQKTYREAGIDLRIQRADWRTMTGRLRDGEYDATILMWNHSARTDPFPYWHSVSRRSGANYFGFANQSADALIDQVRHDPDQASRQESFRELGRILNAEQPITLLYHQPRLSLVHHRLRGVRLGQDWWQPRDWWIDQK